MATEAVRTANDLAGERTDLALERTSMAAGRTMMAWIRTGTSLISFGFSIHKILQTTGASSTARLSVLNPQGPRRLGLTLLFLGVMSIILGTYEYFKTAKRLSRLAGQEYRVKGDLSLAIGAVVGLLGLFLFLSILTNNEVF